MTDFDKARLAILVLLLGMILFASVAGETPHREYQTFTRP